MLGHTSPVPSSTQSHFLLFSHDLDLLKEYYPGIPWNVSQLGWTSLMIFS